MRVRVIDPDAIGLDCIVGREFDLSPPHPHRRHPEIAIYTIVNDDAYNGVSIVSTWFEDGFIEKVKVE